MRICKLSRNNQSLDSIKGIEGLIDINFIPHTKYGVLYHLLFA